MLVGHTKVGVEGINTFAEDEIFDGASAPHLGRGPILLSVVLNVRTLEGMKVSGAPTPSLHPNVFGLSGDDRAEFGELQILSALGIVERLVLRGENFDDGVAAADAQLVHDEPSDVLGTSGVVGFAVRSEGSGGGGVGWGEGVLNMIRIGFHRLLAFFTRTFWWEHEGGYIRAYRARIEMKRGGRDSH